MKSLLMFFGYSAYHAEYVAPTPRRPFFLVLSIHHRDIQPELKGAEAGADIFRDADDRGGQAAADLAGFSQSLAVGQADDSSGKEGIPRAGGVQASYPQGSR